MLSLSTTFSAGLNKVGPTVTALAALMFAGLSPSAQAQNYTFAGTPTTSGGGLTSLILTDSGITATLTRENNATFDIANLGSFAPASWGNRSLDPFSNTTASAFIMTFSAPVDFARIAFGDDNQDADVFVLQAFSGVNGTGTLLGSDTETYSLPSKLPGDVGVGSVTVGGIRSIRFIGGSPSFPNSLYYDNIAVRAAAVTTPEPASYAAFVLGGFALLGLSLTARKRQVIA